MAEGPEVGERTPEGARQARPGYERGAGRVERIGLAEYSVVPTPGCGPLLFPRGTRNYPPASTALPALSSALYERPVLHRIAGRVTRGY